MRKRIPVIDEYCIEAGHARPSANGGNDGIVITHPGSAFNPAFENGPDDAFVDEFVTGFQLSACGPMGHARRGARAAG